MAEPTDPTTGDPQTAVDAAERNDVAAARVEAWLEGYNPILPKAAVRSLLWERAELLAERARMAAELEQVRKAHRRQLGSAIFWRRRAFQLADLIPADQIPDPEWDDNSSVARRAERNEEMHNALTVAAELIDRLAFDDECSLDHHGYCQAHNLHSMPCPHPLGRQFVEAWQAVQVEDAEATATRPADEPVQEVSR